MEKDKKHKGDEEMITINLRDIEKRVVANSSKYQKQIEAFENRAKNSNWNKGRLRPKDPTETIILSRFKRK